MDTIKRKLQSQVLMNTFDRYSPYNLGVGKLGTDKEMYEGIRHCARVIMEREGARGLYKVRGTCSLHMHIYMHMISLHSYIYVYIYMYT
jgi:hypothetical protein